MENRIISLAKIENDRLNNEVLLHSNEFVVAEDAILLNWQLIEEIKAESINDKGFVFLTFYSSLRRHLILALMSCLRHHSIQENHILRHVIESAYSCFYSIEHWDIKLYSTSKDGEEIFNAKDMRTITKRYSRKNLPDIFNELQIVMDSLNKHFTHSKITNVFLNNVSYTNSINEEFFDNRKEYLTKVELRRIAIISNRIIEGICLLNRQFKLFSIQEGFEEKFEKSRAEVNCEIEKHNKRLKN